MPKHRGKADPLSSKERPVQSGVRPGHIVSLITSCSNSDTDPADLQNINIKSECQHRVNSGISSVFLKKDCEHNEEKASFILQCKPLCELLVVQKQYVSIFNNSWGQVPQLRGSYHKSPPIVSPNCEGTQKTASFIILWVW